MQVIYDRKELNVDRFSRSIIVLLVCICINLNNKSNKKLSKYDKK